MVLWDTFMESGREALRAGQIVQAEDLVRSALDEAQVELIEDARLPETLELLAEVLLLADKAPEAAAQLEQALSLRQMLESPAEDRARLQELLYRTHCQTGDQRQATEALTELVQIQRELTELPALSRLGPLQDLAARQREGHPVEALALFREILELTQASFPPEHPNQPEALAHVGLLELQLEQFLESESHLEKAMARGGPAYPTQLEAVLDGLLQLFQRQARANDSLLILEQLIALKQKLDHPPNLLDPLHLQRARLALETEQFEQAESSLQAVDPESSAELQGDIAELWLRLTEKMAPAAERESQLTRTERTLLEQSKLTASPVLFDLQLKLTRMLVELQRWAKADAYLRSCLEQIAAEPGQVSPHIELECLNLKAEIDRNLDRPRPQAELQQSLTLKSQLLGAEELSLTDELLPLSALLLDGGKVDEAEALLRRCLNILETHKALIGPAGEQNFLLLGRVYGSKQRFTQAEMLWKRSLAATELRLGSESRELLPALEQLAHHYRAREKADLLAEAVRRLETLGATFSTPDQAFDQLAEVEDWFNQGLYREVVEALDNLLDQARGLDVESLIKIHTLLAESCERQGLLESSEKWRRQLVQELERLNNPQLGPRIAAEQLRLADCLLGLDRLDEAEPLLQTCSQLHETLHGSESPLVARALTKLAEVQAMLGREATAELSLSRALAILEKTLEPNHPDLLEGRRRLSKLFRSLSRFEEAQQQLQALLVEETAIYGAEHEELLQTLNDLAELSVERGQFLEAEALFRQSVEISRKKLSKPGPALAITLNKLGPVLQQLGHFEEAETLYWEAMQVFQGQPEIYPSVIQTLMNLAMLYRAQHQVTQTQVTLEKALTTAERLLGRHDLEVGRCCSLLASVHLDQKNYERAREYALRSLTIREEGLGADHPDTAQSLIQVSRILSQSGSAQMALPLLRKAVRMREAKLGSEHPDLAPELALLGRILQALQRSSEAEGFLRRALEHLDTATSENSPDLWMTVEALAGARAAQNDLPDALIHYARALDLKTRVLTEEHTEVIETGLTLAGVQLQAGQVQAAEQQLRRLLEIRSRSVTPEHPDITAILLQLGGLYAQQRRSNLAEAMLSRAFANLELAPNDDLERYLEVARSLAAAYLDLQRFEEAEKTWGKVLRKQAKHLGENHLDLQPALVSLAHVLELHGNLEGARKARSRAGSLGKTPAGQRLQQSIEAQNAPLLSAAERQETANALLDQGLWEQGAALLETLRAGEPLDSARALEALARVEIHFERSEAAQQHLQDALALRESVQGSTHADLGPLLLVLADLQQQLGWLDKAEPLLRRFVEVQIQSVGADSVQAGDALFRLGKLYAAQGQSKAEPILERALELLGSGSDFLEALALLVDLQLQRQDQTAARELLQNALTPAEGPPSLWICLANLQGLEASVESLLQAELLGANVSFELGSRLRRAGRLEEAESRLLQAHHGGSNLLQIETELAELYAERGMPRKAEDWARQRLETLASHPVTDPHELLAALTQLGDALIKQQRGPEAASLFRKALDLETDPLARVPLLFRLAELVEPVEAESLQERALETQMRLLGPEHPDVSLSLEEMGKLALRLDQPGVAENRFRRALAILDKNPGSDLARARLMELASQTFLLEDKLNEAEVAARKALEIRQTLYGNEHPEALSAGQQLALVYRRQGKLEAAESFLQRTLEVRKRVLAPEHPDLALTLRALAELKLQQLHPDQAEQLYLKAIAIFNRQSGEHPEFASTLEGLGQLYLQQDRFAEAEPLYGRAVESIERVMGPSHLALADSLAQLAQLNRSLGRLEAAEGLLRKVLEIRQNKLGMHNRKAISSRLRLAETLAARQQLAEARSLYDSVVAEASPELAEALEGLGRVALQQGDLAEAEQHFQQALERKEQQHGPDHAEVAVSLVQLGQLHKLGRRFDGAEKMFRKALEIRTRALGGDKPDTADCLDELGDLYIDQGRYVPAEALFERALEIKERALGEQHLRDVPSLLGLARIDSIQSQLSRAETRVERAIHIAAQHGHANAEALRLAADIFRAQRKLPEAESAYRGAFDLMQKAFGPKHLKMVSCYLGLGQFFQEGSHLSRAEQSFRKALDILEHSPAAPANQVGEALHSLGLLHRMTGNGADAELYLKRAGDIRLRELGPDHPDYASSLFALAQLRLDQHDDAAAEALLKQALAIREKSLRADHPLLIAIYVALGRLLKSQERYGEAEPMFKRVLEQRERFHGSQHLDTALAMREMAELQQLKGKTTQAEVLHRKALDTLEKLLGPEDPRLLPSLHQLISLLRESGKADEAELLATRIGRLQQQLGV